MGSELKFGSLIDDSTHVKKVLETRSSYLGDGIPSTHRSEWIRDRGFLRAKGEL